MDRNFHPVIIIFDKISPMPKKRKKKAGKVVQMPLSPENYIRTRARKLPIGECLINDGWQDCGMATIVISRKHSNGHLTYGLYLVDLYCLGVKDTMYQFNVPGYEYEEHVGELKEKENLIICDYPLAHNVIFGALEFADEFGFSPHKDFGKVTEYLLEEDDERVELMDIEFGLNGKPAVVTEIGKEPNPIIRKLEETVGPGNFEYIFVDKNGHAFFDNDGFDDEFEEVILVSGELFCDVSEVCDEGSGFDELSTYLRDFETFFSVEY